MDSKGKKKNFWLFVGSYTVMLGIGFVLGVGMTWVGKLDKSTSDTVVQMSIDYGDGFVQALPEDLIPEGTSLASYISLVTLRHGIPFDVRSVEGVTYIEAIHDTHSTQMTPWLYTVNDSRAFRDPHQYTLIDGDTIVWKRQTL